MCLHIQWCRAASSTKESEEREILAWINAVGLIFILLPVSSRMYRILRSISPWLIPILNGGWAYVRMYHILGENPVIALSHTPFPPSPFQETYRSPLLEAVLQTLQNSHSFPHPSLHHLVGENRPGCLLSVVHAYWHHANMGVLLSLPQWV